MAQSLTLFTVTVVIFFIRASQLSTVASGTYVPSAAATKARVERGEGVAFFGERFGCREDGSKWSEYRKLVQRSRLRIFDTLQEQDGDLAKELGERLVERTSNVSEILQCNVGIIAGYHLLARHAISMSDDMRAFSLLQLAMIWIFTLRNANRVPSDAAREWFTKSDHLMHEVGALKRRLSRRQSRWVTQLPQVNPGYRMPGLKIALVSICAYPADHPLELKTLTPANREAYARRHGYALHVHKVHPMPDQGVHVQHAKLALVAAYLKTGAYDWVAWFDCDSIIMNMEKTLDSIILRYTHGSAPALRSSHASSNNPHSLVSGNAEGAAESWNVDLVSSDSTVGFHVAHSGTKTDFVTVESDDQPSARGSPQDDDWQSELRSSEYDGQLGSTDGTSIVVFLAHQGSCNTELGCRNSTSVELDPHIRYTLRITTAMIDMEEDNEKIEAVFIGEQALGDCNPSPESDFDCGYYDCFSEVVPDPFSYKDAFLELSVHSRRTNDDCHCSEEHDGCMNRVEGALFEAMGQGVAPPSVGMFVRFEFSPLGAAFPVAETPAELEKHAGAAQGGDVSGKDMREIVAHAVYKGTCNSVHGCHSNITIDVDPKLRYRVTVHAAMTDMEDDSERIEAISVGGQFLGGCNPSPESDFDCRMYQCFSDVGLSPVATATGRVTLEAHSIKTNDDCMCNQEFGVCYAKPLAAMYQAIGEDISDDVSCGMFVKFTLVADGHKTTDQPADDSARRADDPGLQDAVVDDPVFSAASLDEPLEDEVVESYVAHIGSCNSDDGCHGHTRVRVNRNVQYEVTITTALIDMAEMSEKLVSISVGGYEMGGCNQRPDNDYDCGFEDCVERERLDLSVTSVGFVDLRVHAIRSNHDCHCNRLLGFCYSALDAAVGEASGGDPLTDPRYGSFVRFTFVPIERVNASRGFEARLRARGSECVGAVALLGLNLSISDCLQRCRSEQGCEYVAVGIDHKLGRCFWQLEGCYQLEEDMYDVYQVASYPDSVGETRKKQKGQAQRATKEGLKSGQDGQHSQDVVKPWMGRQNTAAGVAENGTPEQTQTGVDVNLLITEEGWGLSSANWMARRSDWSIDFLERAFKLCQEEMPLFGDQDAMIHLLLNDVALHPPGPRGHYGHRLIDAHAAVIPQHELNAYDALNAFYMDAAEYNSTRGDLLVTFPGCKEAAACNPLFRLAAQHASNNAEPTREDLPKIDVQANSWPWVRLFGPPEEAASIFEAARKI